ncbi:MAG: hypothetical protein JWP10_90 [Nocardioidaceae bacterium]|nr:hypothetical protein [Nocardioidaceae bacterium]
MKHARRLTGAFLALLVTVNVAFATQAVAVDAPIDDIAPTISGSTSFGSTLTAVAGTWTPSDATLSVQWQRNGVAVVGATTSTYALTPADIGTRISVVETAIKDGEQASVVSAETAAITPGVITNTKPPKVVGTMTFRKTVKADRGSWSTGGLTYTYRWFRAGEKIKGASKRTYKLDWQDVGEKISVRVTVAKDNFTTTAAFSTPRKKVQHLAKLKRTVTYRVITRGKIRTSLKTVRKLANQTLNDPRGWRGMGVAFREVKKGGNFTLVLSQSSKVSSFSGVCSNYYSCRVGNYVVINQDRWLHATPLWKKVHRSLRDYRNMVVNHETGHWLGHRHAYCSKRGALAPVMQQQSKGLHGCKANPWPKTNELSSSRFRIK